MFSTIPNAVASKRIMGDVSMLQAWCEHLMLLETEGGRKSISQAG